MRYNFYASQEKHGKGWLGWYTFPRDGSWHTVVVRDTRGLPVLYPHEWSAIKAASWALVDALNSTLDKRPSSRSGIFADAQKAFRTGDTSV